MIESLAALVMTCGGVVIILVAVVIIYMLATGK